MLSHIMVAWLGSNTNAVSGRDMLHDNAQDALSWTLLMVDVFSRQDSVNMNLLEPESNIGAQCVFAAVGACLFSLD